jgi:hypothetical protein
MMEERARYNERSQADDVEAPPRVPETFTQAANKAPDGNTLTATQTLTSARVKSERASASSSRAPSGVQPCGRCESR